MKHFVYAMKGSDPAPAAGGDTRSWFMHYKWSAEGEAFVPLTAAVIPPSAGDLLWFVLDGQLLGCVMLIRVEDLLVASCCALTYDTAGLLDAGPLLKSCAGITTGMVSGEEELFFVDMYTRALAIAPAATQDFIRRQNSA